MLSNYEAPVNVTSNFIRNSATHANLAFSLESSLSGSNFCSQTFTHDSLHGATTLSVSEDIVNKVTNRNQYVSPPFKFANVSSVRASIVPIDLIMPYVEKHALKLGFISHFDDEGIVVLSCNAERSDAVLAITQKLFARITKTDIAIVDIEWVKYQINDIANENPVFYKMNQEQLQKIATAVTKAIEKLQR